MLRIVLQPLVFELHSHRRRRVLRARRRSTLHTPHGAVEMPAFMPVGTQGSVKGLKIDQCTTGAQMLLANTYHLALRPGEEVVRRWAGCTRFMGWDGPILTDSGGFQLFSLAQHDHSPRRGPFPLPHRRPLLELSPERAVAIQEALGSDVIMVLDHVVATAQPPEVVRDAAERTVRWAARCRDAAAADDQALFGIVQGGLDCELRSFNSWHGAWLSDAQKAEYTANMQAAKAKADALWDAIPNKRMTYRKAIDNLNKCAKVIYG